MLALPCSVFCSNLETPKALGLGNLAEIRRDVGKRDIYRREMQVKTYLCIALDYFKAPLKLNLSVRDLVRRVLGHFGGSVAIKECICPAQIEDIYFDLLLGDTANILDRR